MWPGGMEFGGREVTDDERPLNPGYLDIDGSSAKTLVPDKYRSDRTDSYCVPSSSCTTTRKTLIA